MSAVLVEQNAPKILPITDRAVILERGAVAYAGASADLVSDAQTLERLLGLNHRLGSAA